MARKKRTNSAESSADTSSEPTSNETATAPSDGVEQVEIAQSLGEDQETVAPADAPPVETSQGVESESSAEETSPEVPAAATVTAVPAAEAPTALLPEERPSSVFALQTARSIKFVKAILGRYFGRDLHGVDMDAVLSGLSSGAIVCVKQKPARIEYVAAPYKHDKPYIQSVTGGCACCLNQELVAARIVKLPA